MYKLFTLFFSDFLYLLFFCGCAANAQNIKGTIVNSDNEVVTLVLVKLLDSDSKLLLYTYTDEQGAFEFEMDLDKVKAGYLVVQSLFYVEQRLELGTLNDFKIIMQESKETLEAVVIKAQKIANDTISLGLGNRNIDRNDKVEDALKKIPGVTVAKDGKIFYFNKEIEKILIDGDDLAGAQYTFISRNLPAEVLQEIEILKNYEENAILRNEQNSNRIALNLKLKDSYKNLIFGNIDGTYGSDLKENQEFKATSTISLLHSKVKLLGSGRFSTLGDRALVDEIRGLDDKQSVMNNNPFYNITRINTPLPETVANFNQATSITFLINKKVGNYDVRNTNYIGHDNLDQFYDRSTVYPLQNGNTLQENFVNNSQTLKFQGELTFNNRNAVRHYFKNTTLYNISKNDGLSNLQAGSQFINDILNQQSLKLTNSNELTTLLNKSIIIQSYVNVGFDNSHENVTIKSSNFLFPSRFAGNIIAQEFDRTNFLLDAASSSRIKLNDKSFLKMGLSTAYTLDILKNESAPSNLGFNFDANFNRWNVKAPIAYVYQFKPNTSFIAKAAPRYNSIDERSFYLLDYCTSLI